MRGASVELDRVTKRFGRVVAVDRVSLRVERGEFFAILGPSGSGKTTTLRIIAGLERPDEGRVLIDGRDVTRLDPGERDVAMVFQDYAIYPHMTVYENIAFPLVVRRRRLGLSREEIDERVRRVARMLGIEELLDRKATQLSGGQQQRVALARAIVKEARVWLMDEPLSNLDAVLRVHVRAELKRLQRQLGVTTIYVTHDQVEALSMADRIAVMERGRVVQVGTPTQVYEEPSHVFVASFVGSPPMNLLPCRVSGRVMECPGLSRTLPEGVRLPARVYLGFRPEHARVYPKPVRGGVEAEVYVVEPLGSEHVVTLRLGDHTVKVKAYERVPLQPGDRAYLVVDWARAHVFDAETGRRIARLAELEA